MSYHAGTAPVVVGLLFMGFGLASWNVAMNVPGALVERHAGRAIMPSFHAGFGIATVVSGLFAAALIAIGVTVTVHLILVAALVAVTVLLPLTIIPRL